MISCQLEQNSIILVNSKYKVNMECVMMSINDYIEKIKSGIMLDKEDALKLAEILETTVESLYK